MNLSSSSPARILKLLVVAVLLATSATTIAVSTSGSAQASTSGCVRKGTALGQNGYGYASSAKAMVRAAAKLTYCLKHSATSGYYFSTASCSGSTARLTHDNLKVRRSTPYRSYATYAQVNCSYLSDWQWDKTLSSDEWFCSVGAETRWDVNPSTGAVTHVLTMPHEADSSSSCP